MRTESRLSFKDEFSLAARQDEIRRREMKAFFAEQERQRRKEDMLDDRQQDSEMMMAVETILASSEEIAAYRVELSMYDTATVEALMDNQEKLDDVRDRIDAMLTEAYVLPDGRRVFKTMDGLHVFDEQGQELSKDIIDPDSIADHKPKWETFKDALDEKKNLMAERRQLLDYQAKLDEARDRLDNGEITQKEFEALKADLAETMPQAVFEKLGPEQQQKIAEARADIEPAADAMPEQTTAASALPSDMDNLMRQTGLAPAPF